MGDEWEYTADKHAKTMERVFESIHDIHLIVTRNEGRISEVKESMNKMAKAMDGDGANEGIKGMVGTVQKQLTLQWVLILGSYGYTTMLLVWLVIKKI
ncbi:MAG: hypothetical protein B6242_12305 [Anaerolineaceae bacterium 4572_78]|nr:MAG: hypothetical protein B6242_12305 [Anaerolineaceae bacterium 4572_78]